MKSKTPPQQEARLNDISQINKVKFEIYVSLCQEVKIHYETIEIFIKNENLFENVKNLVRKKRQEKNEKEDNRRIH